MSKVLLLLALTTGAYPCTKLPPRLAEEQKAARLVFVGRVVKTELSGGVIPGALGGSAYPIVVTVKVERSWKGVVPPIVFLYAIPADNCGDDDPIAGYRYLFFTREGVGGKEWEAVGKAGQKIERVSLAYPIQYEDVDKFLKDFRSAFGQGKAVR